VSETFGTCSVTSRIPPVLDPVPPRIATGSPPIISPKPGVILANRLWCAFIAFLHLAVLVCAVLGLQGVIGRSTGLIEELLTPKEGPLREALLAEKRQEFGEIAPLRLTDRSAADGRGKALVPGDVVPEAGKLGMGEVGGAVETVAVFGA
jgi:hypothetical protein